MFLTFDFVVGETRSRGVYTGAPLGGQAVTLMELLHVALDDR
jgi:hypothetical protein